MQKDKRVAELKKRCRFAALAMLLICVLISSCPGKREYIGTYDMSHYCLEEWGEYHICGNSELGVGGDTLVPGRSIAVPRPLLAKYPVGTEVEAVYPDGERERLVIHDTGQALERLGRIDMPVKTHSEAMKKGVIKGVELYLIK